MRNFLDAAFLSLLPGWIVVMIEGNEREIIENPLYFFLELVSSCILMLVAIWFCTNTSHAKIEFDEEEETKDKVKRLLIEVAVLIAISYGCATA